MKVGFIRALWGIHEHKGRRFYLRRTKIDADINLVLHNKYCPPFKTYVFGKDNYNYLVDKGFDCKLLDDRPIVWDLDTKQFRHKFEVFKAAAEDFDKFVFVDWDMMFIKPLPTNFWDVLATKQTFQAILRVYHQKKACWRGHGARIIPCGSFMYFGDKTLPSKFIDIWEKMGEPWGEEVVMAKYTEDIMGGFNGCPEHMEKYWNMFEPPFFALQDMYSKEKMASKIRIIEHFNARGVGGFLHYLKNSSKMDYDWVQREIRNYRKL